VALDAGAASFASAFSLEIHDSRKFDLMRFF
jgi:hypothetical protein